MSERLYAVACAAMLVFGIVLGLPGTVLGLPDMVQTLGLTLAGRGALISTLFVGLLIGSVASGAVVDALGFRTSLAASAACIAVALLLFASATTAPLAAASLAVLGVAAAGVNTASNALSSDLFPRERAKRMNRLGLMAGIGGLTMPLMTVVASVAVSWRIVVVGGAVLATLVAAAGARVRMDSARSTPPHSTIDATRHLLRQPHLAWFALLLLLGGGNEASIAGWTSTYLQAAGFSTTAATWMLSSHWLGLIVARALLSHRVEHVKQAAISRSAIAGALFVVVFMAARTYGLLAVMPFAIGLAIALVVPTTLALAGDRYTGNPGTIFGLLLTLLQVGGIALPAAIGLVSNVAGLRVGLSVVVASCLCIAVVTHVTMRPGR